MELQRRSRAAGESRAQLSLIRLLCAASIWRTAVTRILPLCGSAGWWVTLICLLPGFGAAVLLRLAMLRTDTTTVTEAVRSCLGRGGAWAAALLITGLLLVDGVSSSTALITMFTEGIGTRGTQLTLAVLTGALLLFSLHREGLARAVHLLRWGIVAAALVLAANLAGKVKVDHIFPLHGDGDSTIWQAIRAGAGAAWPLFLLLTVPSPGKEGRLRSGILPAFCTVGFVLLMLLTVPHEMYAGTGGLADSLLLVTRYVPNGLKVMARGLLMLVFFLAIGASAQLASSALCMPLRQRPDWLPCMIVMLMLLTQAGDIAATWRMLGQAEPWLALPVAGLGAGCLIISLFRRKRI